MQQRITERQRPSNNKPFFGKQYAQVFDLIMKEVPYESWALYTLDIAKVFGVKPLTILDVGCGTGTFIIHLAQQGVQCVGIDQSPHMIARCREKCQNFQPSPRFYCQKSWSLKLPNHHFDVICSFFDSINYITDRRFLLRTFQKIAQLLKSGGIFIFDIATEYAYENALIDQANFIESQNIHYQWFSSYDRNTKICTIKLFFELRNKMAEFLETHFQRAYSIQEIVDSLNSNGLKVLDIYRAFSFKKLRNPENEERLTFVVGVAN